MVLGHLAVGMAVGVATAVASLLMGFSFLAALGMYVLSSNAGVLASAVYAAAAPMRAQATQDSWA